MSYNGCLEKDVETPNASVIVSVRAVEAVLTATVVVPWRVVAAVLPIALAVGTIALVIVAVALDVVLVVVRLFGWPSVSQQ